MKEGLVISIESNGGFDKTEAFLHKVMAGTIFDSLSRFGAAGVTALAAATPVDDGVTANSWDYEIVRDATSWSIIWNNTNVVDGTPVVVLLQHGHGTRNGGYVSGRDFINPALQPVFDQIAAEAWKVVTSA